MRKLTMTLALCVSLLNASSVQAQVRVNINVGSQPDWGPVGYDYVEYYYLPDIEAYYYVPRRQFVYLSGPRWVFTSGLPPMYRSYNLYSGYKVVINRPKAYLYHNTYKVRYAGYKGKPSQVIIKNHKGPKFSNGNGRGQGQIKAKGRGRGRN